MMGILFILFGLFMAGLSGRLLFDASTEAKTAFGSSVLAGLTMLAVVSSIAIVILGVGILL